MLYSTKIAVMTNLENILMASIRKLRRVQSRAGKELLFKLIALPHVRYCTTILSMTNKMDIENMYYFAL